MLKVIKSLGYDVEVINYVKRYSILDKIVWAVNAYRCGMLGRVTKSSVPKRLESQYREYMRLRTAAVDRYKAKKILPLFRDYVGFDALCRGSRNYDAVVVGSDQVWLPVSLPSKFYNLLFVDDSVRKIAYASSFGVQDIPAFQHKATGRYLERFYRIGVREQRGKEIVESLSGKPAVVVADPTLLLSREEWEAEIGPAEASSREPFIFSYLISENEIARREVTELARKKKMKVICIRHLEQFRNVDETYGDEAPYDVGPNDFIRLIRDAAFVCTDSFHCTVFSHVFHKRFLTFYRGTASNNARNSRIDSLFSVLGTAPEHLFERGGLEGIDVPVDWEAVDGKLGVLRDKSMDFLKEALR